MAVPQFNVQFARVGKFVRRYQNIFGSAVIRVFSNYIQVDFKTFDVLRSFPDGADEMCLYSEDGAIIIRCCFYCQEEKEDAE